MAGCLMVASIVGLGDVRPAGGQTDDPPLSEIERQQLSVFGPVLVNPSGDIAPETRRDSALGLIRMGIPQAFAVVERGLTERHPAVVQAILAAIETTPPDVRLDPLLDELVTVLRQPPANMRDRLASAVSRFGEPGFWKVEELAVDRRLPESERLGAVLALGSFHTSDSAERLVRLLDPDRDEPETVVDAACDALQRLTGLHYGRHPDAWRRWWAEARDQSPEEWLSHVVEQLSRRQVDLEDRARSLESRLVQAYRDLYPSLSPEQQLQHLPALLADDVDAVRRFAIGRVDLLRRDSVPVPVAIREALGLRLDDAVPDHREAAATVLDLLDDPALPTLLLARLDGREKDTQVIKTSLRILERRPRAAALGPARTLAAGDDRLIDPVAKLIWAIITSGAVDDQPDLTRTTAMEMHTRSATPATARLLAAVGDDEAIATLTPLLDGDDAALTAAVAAGFLHRGLRAPLVDRASIAAVYPFSVRALASGPADLAALQSLVGLVPTDPHVGHWTAGVRQLVGRLPLADIIASDTMLESASHATPTLRSDLMERVFAGDDATALTPALRLAIVRRLAPLLIQLDRPARAHDLIVSLNGAAATDDDLTDLLFSAALLAGRFEAAVAIHSTPGPWVDVLTAYSSKTASIRLLFDEIARRFADELAGDLKTRYDAVGASLPANASPAEPQGDSITAADTGDE